MKNTLANTFMLAMIVIGLTACGSTSQYKEASSDKGIGYREQALSADQWLVNYRSRGTDQAEAYSHALRRAAELTVRVGYDWFEVVHQTGDVDKRESAPGVSTGVSKTYNQQTNCGLLGCTTRTTPSTSYEVGVNTGTSSRSEAESQLEIRMGKGVSPEGKRIYQAADILARNF